MRTGGCSIQQSLTPEAATIVKQAINLARRRGHAQVTPIHIASVMLASPAGLLRIACLKSHSHPLQCKALELCFNVALNRLPTTTPTPILGPNSHYPALANALMAAFKRAQAHQRRGSIETQQQPILALKIETEQLVVSVLDDPSVSRVMREAGFSSPHVKSNVEQTVSSIEGCSQTTTVTSNNNNNNITTNIKAEIVSTMVFRSSANHQTLLVPSLNQFEIAFSKPFSQARSEDVSSVIDSWVNRREKSSVVLVGECLGSCEGVIRGVKERVERGDHQVPVELRYVQFLYCPLSSMKNLSREEIDMKLGEIRCLLKGCVGRGVVLYLGDLKWVAEYWAYYGEQRRHYYCPVEHLIMGLRRLIFGNLEINGRLWLMGIATFNSYMKCKSGIASLETLLDLHPITIPAESLDLSLNLDSCIQGQNKSDVSGEGISWPLVENKIDMQLTCCMDCSTNCHREARSLTGLHRNNKSTTTTTTTSPTTSTTSSLPPWLQKCKEESTEISTDHQKETMQMKELCKKWNMICSTAHKTSNLAEKTINFSSCSPSSSTSVSSYEHNKPHLHEPKPISTWPMLFEPKWETKEHHFLISNIERKPELLSNPNSTPNSASSSEATEAIMETPFSLSVFRFKENNPENLEAMCSSLEKKVPWQKDIIPEIATTILRIGSGIMSRKTSKRKFASKEEHQKKETWLFFLGVDEEGKLGIARELAKLIFGSYSRFKSIGLSSFASSTRADSSDELRSKRVRDESGGSYLERFAEAVRENPHRVFFVEDIEQLDHRAQKGIKRAIETGHIKLSDGEIVALDDAIVIFSCDSFSSASRACSPSVKQKLDENDQQEVTDQDEVEEATSCVPLDLNVTLGDDDGSEDLVGNYRILESVDKQVFFKIHVL